MTVTMRILLASFAICFILNTALCGLTDQSTLCRLKSEVSYDEALSISENKLPETYEGKCYLACLLQENKAMVNGQVLPDVALDLIDEQKQMNEGSKRKLAIKMTKCADSANVERDECESAYRFIACIRQGEEDSSSSSSQSSSSPNGEMESGRTISIKLPQTINLMIPPLSLPPFNLVLFMLG